MSSSITEDFLLLLFDVNGIGNRGYQITLTGYWTEQAVFPCRSLTRVSQK